MLKFNISFLVVLIWFGLPTTGYAQYLDKDYFSLEEKNRTKRPPSQALYRQYIENASYYFSEGLHQEAKNLLWEAINLFPENPDAYVNLATIYIDENDTETALRYLKKAKKLAALDYHQKEILFYNLGLCFYIDEDFKNAKENFKEAVKEYPNFGEAMYYLGLSCFELGQSQEAFINIFAARYTFDKENKIDYRSKAEESLKSLAQKYPIDNTSLANTFFKEGKKSLANNELNKALALLQESVFLNPRNIDVYYELALLYSRKNAFYNAIIYLNKMIEVDPGTLKAYLVLGYAYQKLKKYEQAIEAFEAALELQRDNPVIYYDIGMVYLEDRKYNTAKKYLGKAKRYALRKKDSFLLKRINEAYLEIEHRDQPPHPLPVAIEKSKPKKEKEPLYPYHKISGNEGYLEGGYFMTLPKKQPESKEKSKSRISTFEY
jgi:tetratricopeptide (TPR) repeat protein